MAGFRVEGNTSGNVAEVTATNELKVALATTEAATTKAPRRIPLGYMTWPVGAAIGQGPQDGELFIDFGDAPVFVNPGEFIALVGKFLVGTATASQTISFVWQPIYGWE